MSSRWPEEKKTPLAKLRGGLTIEKAAVAMDITGRTLSRYENGMADVPMKIVDKMIKLYQVSIETIYRALKETWAKSAERVYASVPPAQAEQVSMSQSQHIREGYVPLEEAAKIMDMSPSDVEDWCQWGVFQNAYMSGWEWFLPLDELEEGKSRMAERVAENRSDAIQEAHVEEEPQYPQNVDTISEGYLSLEEAAKELKMLPIFLRNVCQRGRLPNVVKSGEDWLIPIEALQIVKNMSDAELAGG